VIDTDLNGAFWCARAARAKCCLPGGGSIVNIGSIASETGLAGRASYTTAKAGLSGMTRTLALEWAERGIRVNTVAPGWTRTEMVQTGFDTGTLSENRTHRPDTACNALPSQPKSPQSQGFSPLTKRATSPGR